MHILLETGRLRLRRFAVDDADLLVALDADPEVMRYITYGQPTPRSAYVETYLPRWLAIYQAQPGLGYFAAERRDTGEFLGWFHLRDDRIDPEYVELGYRFKRSAWRHGYATEGARALLQHGFNGLGLARISARTLLGNLASQHVMQKCGLRRVGEFVYVQDVIDRRGEAARAAVKYAITRPEWDALSR
ncbi:MAG: GNAT family N-acetyltransferase [Steroidobacteraceae bacterium]|jgi:RimJ/RimL family protein N-acetyltransferase|nr:GNAT family N-acetyltransferase [Steroidobacteraceae bacterium]MBP7013599.1 GNAT family N-acetyltransferase [Steroidobacteraceae bacterium]